MYDNIPPYLAIPVSIFLTLAFIVVVLRQRKLERDHQKRLLMTMSPEDLAILKNTKYAQAHKENN